MVTFSLLLGKRQWLCSAITRSRQRGRRQIFVMRAARHRSDAHPEGLADPTAGQWCRGGHKETGGVGKWPNDGSRRHDHATITPQLGEGPAKVSVRPGSNICGAHLVERKYRRLFSSSASPRRKPGPKGPSAELIAAIVALKRRNPHFGCVRIAQQTTRAFGVEIDKDVVRRVLARRNCQFNSQTRRRRPSRRRASLPTSPTTPTANPV